MQALPDNCIDLIYIDPPFFTQKDWGAYSDKWEGGLTEYINWLTICLNEMRRILKKTGSIYIHCDWHASHYIKVAADTIFGYDNFKNEIAWCYAGPSNAKRHYPRKHDTLLFYAYPAYTFNPDAIRVPYKKNLSTSVSSSYFGTDTNEERVAELDGVGKIVEDWWTGMPSGGQMPKKDRNGYRTEKPSILLERIVRASSNCGDLIADFFCGAGVTGRVGCKLNRKWLLVDNSEQAISICKNLLEDFTYTETNR